MRRFGKVVEGLRRANDWRQEDLAERLGCSQSMISKVEKSTLCPKVDDLPRWAVALDVPLILLVQLVVAPPDSQLADQASITAA